MALPVDRAKLQASAMSKVLDMVDLTPDVLAKTFKDFGESPEKLRALLNLWFVPWFKPTFVPDPNYAVAGLRDVEFLGTADLPPGQRPYRMFDIETGNLVEFPAIGARGQYCMLSHRWKGVELTLSYIKEARKRELDRAREAAKDGRPTRSRGKKSDVDLVLAQSRLDIEEQETLIRELYVEDESAGISGDVNVGELLDRRLTVRAAEDGLGGAKDKEDEVKSRLQFAQIEQKIFSHLVDQMQDQVDEKLEEHLGKPDATGKPSKRGVGSEVVNGVQTELATAEASLRAAEIKREAVKGDIEYFKRHHHLRDALDEMVPRLQMWKSAIKLDQAIQQADRIFTTKLFQSREKCYLWTDTCCIDKTNGGEHSESLSLMGDWYADAEYTVVQLDTPFQEADAVEDWRRFEAERKGDKSTDSTPNIQSFWEIGGTDPEWSKRAWTLQELVLSKTTFYVNSKWAPLSRPVESLGYFYYLIPFISVYTRGDTGNIYRSACAAAPGFWNVSALEGILENQEALGGLKSLRDNIQGSLEEEAVTKVEVAQKLIALLEAVGVRIPSDLATETATSELARAVYHAAADLTSGHVQQDCGKRRTFLRLQKHLPSPDLASLPDNLSEQEKEEEIAQHAINFVLQSLVAETERLIVADRAYVADFGQVEQLGGWQQGTSRTGFSAQSVLEASGKRRATVATDASYALMGVLGVRFPTFPAEGSVKALARLLDEVVIARNDISVFNWTGMEMGSTIRGRSLYPSSQKAYGNQGDRGKRYNLLLSARVQDKMEDVMETYHTVIHTLRSAIDFLKDKERKNLPLGWIERIVQLVRLHSLRDLKPQQDAFGKIIGYIAEHCRKEREALAREKEAKISEPAATPTTIDKGSSFLKRPAMPSMPSLPSMPSMPSRPSMPSIPSMPSMPSMPSLPTTSFSLPGRKTTAPAKEAESVETTKKTSKFSGLGVSVKTPSFGFGKKAADPTTPKQPAVADVPATPQSPEPTETISEPPPPPYEEVEPPPPMPSWQDVDHEVMEYLITPPAQRTTKTLPPDLQAIQVTQPTADLPSAHTAHNHNFEPHNLDTISPNPIIINNSGIEGLFDIQRVIITMVDPAKLRRQIAKASSAHDKISGWCSISTGFARVITSFACERRVLEQELDVIESVEARVLREQDRDKGDRRGDRLLKTLSVARAGPAAGSGSADQPPKTEDPSPPKPPTDEGNTTEERLISRMIAFIQHPDLHLIAGEWVLARFASTPGANWFLVHLTLGPTAGQFYGQRIAAGAIDFGDATPEPGLVHAWQTYMDRKKRKMCYILADYLRSRAAGGEGEERLRKGGQLARSGLDLAAKGVELGAGEEEQQQSGGEDDSDADEDGEGSVLDRVLGQGKLAARALGEYTALAVAEKLFEMRADRLDKKLATVVLKRTPKSLRTAVENMNDDKSFLPAMFHSSTRVHMF